MLGQLLRGALVGAAAGAAGTAALNTVTYLDMAVRGRPSSDTPERTVEAMLQRVGAAVPGDGPVRENRLTGLGALSGTAAGVGVGAVAGFARAAGLRPNPAVGGLLFGLAAMVAGNLPMVRLGITDPRRWSATDWASDLVPHLAYGAVGYPVLSALDRPPRRRSWTRAGWFARIRRD